MEWIIKKANEIRKKYGTGDIEELAQKLGAEVVEEKLGRIIKEAYFKDLKVIVIDPDLHPYKKSISLLMHWHITFSIRK